MDSIQSPASDHSSATQAHGNHFGLDTAILDAIAKSSEIVSAERYDNSSWASTGRIQTRSVDGTAHDYFFKIVKGDFAAERVIGEHSCMSELYKAMPSIVPTPRGFGQCLDTDGHYFICDYINITHEQPDPVRLAQRIVELHKTSVSPTGQFGFHVTPYDGKLPLNVAWDSSWESFYTKLLRGVYELDIDTNGIWKELDDAMSITLEKVIPRLLGPLEKDGRFIKPCLIHGDLWEANIGTEQRTGEIYVFDSCAYYAHHEMAVGMWRVDHHRMSSEVYRDEYFKLLAPDEPREEYDDRNRLYAIKERIMYSAHIPGSQARVRALKDMQYLIEKFVNCEDTFQSADILVD
ncbi:Fructosamine kinase-domain-containing protein [Xylariaceae sp. FL1019]|nr:Fructosamine kinase-domain-containing protein [Xylariaceae sp. FL1019]